MQDFFSSRTSGHIFNPVKLDGKISDYRPELRSSGNGNISQYTDRAVHVYCMLFEFTFPPGKSPKSLPEHKRRDILLDNLDKIFSIWGKNKELGASSYCVTRQIFFWRHKIINRYFLHMHWCFFTIFCFLVVKKNQKRRFRFLFWNYLQILIILPVNRFQAPKEHFLLW